MKKYLMTIVAITQFSNAYIGCYSSGCTEFVGTKNIHGAVLKSTGIQYRWVGYGVASKAEKIIGAKKLKKVVLYLGKSCDTYSKSYGKGTWEWANGGFIVKFKNEEFGFGRQEIDIDRDEEFGCQMK